MNWFLDRKVSLYLTAVIVVAIVVCAAVGGWQYLMADPRVILLRPDHSAQWIRCDSLFDPARFDFDTTAEFVTWVDIASPANLEITGLRRVSVFIDGTMQFDSGPDLSKWKTIYRLSLKAGHHRLRFVVSNQRGPSLLRVACPAIGITSNAKWQASVDGQAWSPAVLAVDRPDPQLPPQFGSTAGDFIRLSPVWGSLFVIGFLFCLQRSLNGSIVRWMMIGGWTVMAANNIMKVPLQFGYDADSHYLYIHYVADRLSLPRPDAGWQYFQSPLYYLLSAVLDRLLILIGVADHSIPYLLRLIPLTCGAVMVELCFRASRVVFPTRSDLQAIATMIGGFLPVNIYMSQAVSNEPLGAVISAWITLLCLRILIKPNAICVKDLALIGVALGLGFITKINTVLWVFPSGMALAIGLVQRRSGVSEWIKSLVVVTGVTLCVSGGLFVRNISLIHKPFFLESSVANSQWWQDPGYRIPQMFYEFGKVFSHPVYNGLSSVWDSLYGTLWANGIPTGRPPWNYSLMSCGLWLGLVPTIAITIGIGRALCGKSPHLWFAVLALGCFVAAVLYVYLTLPIYSCGKASYCLGTAPCIGLLAAAGFDGLMKNRWLRAGFGGAVLCWALTAYLTYFVIG